MMKSGVFLIALCTAVGAFAHPRDDGPPPTENVAFGDLNFASAVDQAILRHRIQAAAGNVCDSDGMRSLEEFAAAAQCYRSSYADGLRQMDKLVAGTSSGPTLAASALPTAGKKIAHSK